MQEGDEEMYPMQETDTGPGLLSRVGLVIFMTAAAVIFVAAVLMSL